MYIDLAGVLQAVTALAVLANTLLSLWTNRKVAAVHTQMNGMRDSQVAAAELSGWSRGAGQTPPPPPP
jgi:hypothetical protein